MEVAIPRTEIERNAWRGSAFPRRGAGERRAPATSSPAVSPAARRRRRRRTGCCSFSPRRSRRRTPSPTRTRSPEPRSAKLEATDEQTGEVGELTDQPLAVEVRDIYGAPVLGAAVTFASFSGGGSFVDDEGHKSSSLFVLTNAQGVAQRPLPPRHEHRDRAGLPPEESGRRLHHPLRRPASSKRPSPRTRATSRSRSRSPFSRTRAGDCISPGPTARSTRSGRRSEPRDLGRHASPSRRSDRFENSGLERRHRCRESRWRLVDADVHHPVLDPNPAAVFERGHCLVPVPLLGECGDETASEPRRPPRAPSVRRHLRQRAAGVSCRTRRRPEFPAVTPELRAFSIARSTAAQICSPRQSWSCKFVAPTLRDEQGHNIQATAPGGRLWARSASKCSSSIPWEAPTVTLPGGSRCHGPAAAEWWRLDAARGRSRAERSRCDVSNGGSALEALQLEPGLYETSVRRRTRCGRRRPPGRGAASASGAAPATTTLHSSSSRSAASPRSGASSRRSPTSYRRRFSSTTTARPPRRRRSSTRRRRRSTSRRAPRW